VRPVQVLKCHLIPATATDEQVTDLLRAMPEHPGMYERVVDALFASPGGAGGGAATASAPDGAGGLHTAADGADALHTAQLSVSRDGMVPAGVPVAATSAHQLAIIHSVQRICHTHGCVPMESRVVRRCVVCSC
jgi:hypothetical protein